MGMALKFNPNSQTDDESVANFIARRYEFESVIDALIFATGSHMDAPRFLVSAPRGAGKTTLCRRVIAETRLSPILRQAWQSVYLREESYAVTTSGEFFLECLLQLKDQAPSEQLTKNYIQATAARSEAELVELTLGSLRDFNRTTGKRLLVIVENFHTILNEQIQNSNSTGAKVLIDNLDNNTLFAVLATSVTQLSDDNSIALPEHYHRLVLLPLSLGECSRLWESLSGTETNEEKLRPLQILTGGNPRLLHILAEFTRTPSLHNLMANLNYLVDQNTEYFKNQLDALPTLERKVFVTLLDMWDPSTAKRVAEAARVNTNTASAMLARLSSRGAVIKELGQGHTANYVAAERLFNIYYLMCRHSRPSSRIRALVNFMMTYYDSDELVDTTAHIMREACGIESARRSDYHSTFDALMSNSSETVRCQIRARTSLDFTQSFRDDKRASLELTSYLPREPSEAEQDVTIQALIKRIEKTENKDDLDTTYDLLMEGIQRNSEMYELWIRLSFLELRRGNTTAAIKAGEKAKELRPNDSWSHAVLGQALALVGRTDEAEASYLAAIERDPGQSLAITNLASIREHRGDLESALTLFEFTQESQALTDLTRCTYGKLLDRGGRKAEAETILREGAYDFENGMSRHALVEFLESQGRQDEGIQLLETVAKAKGRWESWADLGNYLMARTSYFHEAKNALRMAINLGGNQPCLYAQLATAISESGGDTATTAAMAVELVSRFPKLSEAWVTTGLIYEALDHETEAEAAYRAALKCNNGELALVPLARMLRKQGHRRVEAEELLRQSVTSTKGRRKCVPLRDLAELLIHNGNDLHAAEAIEAALQANDRCACCLILRGDIYRRGADTSTAERYYRAAISVDKTAITALTGLAQIVSPNEAQELIEQAVDADPHNPSVLLARARLNSSDLDAQAKDAKAALNLSPKFIEAHLFLASLEANRSNLHEAIGHLEAVLTDLPSRRELIPSFVSAAMITTELDNGVSLSSLLDRHENAVIVEPLAIAVQIARGDNPMVAKEIMDVAWDIVVRSSTQMWRSQL